MGAPDSAVLAAHPMLRRSTTDPRTTLSLTPKRSGMLKVCHRRLPTYRAPTNTPGRKVPTRACNACRRKLFNRFIA